MTIFLILPLKISILSRHDSNLVNKEQPGFVLIASICKGQHVVIVHFFVFSCHWF